MSKSHEIRAVLCDLDGTLADSYTAIGASVNFVRAHRGLPSAPAETVRAAVGNGVKRLIEQTVPAGAVEENVALFAAHHPTVLAEGTKLLPGVEPTLKALASAGVKLGVCSNKPLALTKQLLKLVGLVPLFDVILGPELVARPKPAPDMLHLALARLAVAREQAVYVGDMTIDVATGRAAGVCTWVIASGSHDAATLRAADPDRLLEHFDDLLTVISQKPECLQSR